MLWPGLYTEKQSLVKNKEKKINSAPLQPVFYIHLKTITELFFTFYNNFFNAQPTFVFHIQEGSYIVCNHIETLFLFLLQKDFDTSCERFFCGLSLFFNNINIKN